MTQWHIVHADIHDYPAEGLLCTAIPNLNLSGGVSTTALSQKPRIPLILKTLGRFAAGALNCQQHPFISARLHP